MRRIGWGLLVLLAFMVSTATIAYAQKRVALVIGNGAYTKVPTLPNPPRDAAALEKLLRASSFDFVRRADNLDLAGLRRTLREFSTQVTGADIAVVFFAGHGVEVNGTNYLIPVDAILERDLDVEDEALPLERVSQILEPAKLLRLIILDACRDNPFVRSMKRTVATRSIGRGLANIEVLSPNTLIAYAAKAGSTAADGSGANSPYTIALLGHLATPGLDVRLAFGRVRDEVLKATGSRQEPFVYGSLGGAEIALVPAKPEAPKPAEMPSALGRAATEWDTLRTKSDIAELEAFAKRHQGTYFADLARARIEELKRQQVVVATPFKMPTPLPYVDSPKPVPYVEPPKPFILMPAPQSGCVEVSVGAGERRCLTPGAGKNEQFKDCPNCPEMVVVPSGRFAMGAPADEPEREGAILGTENQISVTIAQPIAVGRFSVTRGEFAAFASATGHKTSGHCFSPITNEWKQNASKLWTSVVFAQTDRHPVVCVNWDDAKAYVAWLSSVTGKSYRLLSETEREYVSRAGTTTPFWWGSSITPEQANYNGTSDPYKGGGSKGQFLKATMPVDSFAANPWGLYNVHGNAWEWTEDCWTQTNAGNPGDGSPRTTGNCVWRVIRGGGWASTPAYLRSAKRVWQSPDYRSNHVGFRIARTL
jgi:formylglycine-generating enzyme required for sulfatase activity